MLNNSQNHTQCAKVMAVGLRARERQHPGSVDYGDLALLPPALVRCAAAASAGGVYKMAPSVGAAGCYANGKSPARHCLARGALAWLYAYDRASQVPQLWGRDAPPGNLLRRTPTPTRARDRPTDRPTDRTTDRPTDR